MYTSETSVWFPMLQLTEEKTIFCHSETRVVSRFFGSTKIPVTVTGHRWPTVRSRSATDSVGSPCCGLPQRSPFHPDLPHQRWPASHLPQWITVATRFWNGPLKGCENTCGTSLSIFFSCHWKGHRNVKLKCTRCEASEGIDVKNHAWVLPHIPA